MTCKSYLCPGKRRVMKPQHAARAPIPLACGGPNASSTTGGRWRPFLDPGSDTRKTTTNGKPTERYKMKDGLTERSWTLLHARHLQHVVSSQCFNIFNARFQTGPLLNVTKDDGTSQFFLRHLIISTWQFSTPMWNYQRVAVLGVGCIVEDSSVVSPTMKHPKSRQN